MLNINSPYITNENGKTRLNSDIVINGKKQILWFEITDEFALAFDTINLDGFLVALLTRAMMDNVDIKVNGTICSQLYYNLTHSLLPILSVYFNKPRINIIVDRLDESGGKENVEGKWVVSGLSCGVDSFCAYYDHSEDRAPKDFRLTHFIFNNVGSHGQISAEVDHATFDEKFKTVRNFATQENKPCIPLNSNLDHISGSNFQKTHTFRNMAVALILQNRVGKLLYASGTPFNHIHVSEESDPTWMEPIILPLLSSKRLSCIPTGGESSRVEKTQKIVNISASKQYLDVCVHPWNAAENVLNCSVCWKCMRTQMTLDVLGELDNYNKVFELRKYHMYKNLYLICVLQDLDVLYSEIKDLIKGRDYKVPVNVEILSMIIPKRLSKKIPELIVTLSKRPKLSRIVHKVLG